MANFYQKFRSRRVWTILAMMILLAGCLSGRQTLSPTPVPPTPALAEELVFYDWLDDMPQSVLDAFTAEYGVRVHYLTYGSQDEAVEKMRTGETLDVVVLENQLIPALVQEELLAEIDYRRVTNFKNISANFRNLVYDPENAHSIPFNWGTTGLVVRSDLTEQPVDSWAELWNPAYAGKAAVSLGTPRDVLGVALKSLGYSANSEQPEELEQALQQLLQFKPNAVLLDSAEISSVGELLAEGEIVISVGWALDALDGRARNPAVHYVLPKEGALLWGDNFVIPSSSRRKETAEVFLNFLLRPEISAQIVNHNLYATPNEAAYPLIDPAILNDPVVFPPNEDLQNVEILLPLSPEGEQLYEAVWQQFLAE